MHAHPEQMLDSLADGAERARRTLGVATASVRRARSVWAAMVSSISP